MITKKSKDSSEHKFLTQLLGGPLTVGMALEALRKSDETSQVAFAKILGISKAHLCDIEKGRRLVGPGRAAKFAMLLGHPPEYFVKLALEDLMRDEGLKLKVEVRAA